MNSPVSAQTTDMIMMRMVRLLVKYCMIAPVHTESHMMKTSRPDSMRNMNEHTIIIHVSLLRSRLLYLIGGYRDIAHQ